MCLLVGFANEPSVSAAARAIGVTQSTASERVRPSTLWSCCGKNAAYAAACAVPPPSLLRARPKTS